MASPPAPRVILVFVDGLGLAPRDAPGNPLPEAGLDLLACYRDPAWIPPPDGGRPDSLPAAERDRPLPHRGRLVVTDPSLGVSGLPQSATGQTAILTGENAALVLGRHLYGFPTRTLQKMLRARSILKQVTGGGRRAVFLNAFRPLFFELGDAVWTRPMSATTWANRAAGLPFRTFEDLGAGAAIYQDITHDSLQDRHPEVPGRTPEAAGGILARVSREFDFTLFEFFQTDKAGHARDRIKAVRELRKLERFLAATLAELDPETNLILTSDHGNVEDLTVKTHTHNPVPTLIFGPEAPALDTGWNRLESLYGRILAVLDLPTGPGLADSQD